jgi:hypothetical protein
MTMLDKLNRIEFFHTTQTFGTGPVRACSKNVACVPVSIAVQ